MEAAIRAQLSFMTHFEVCEEIVRYQEQEFSLVFTRKVFFAEIVSESYARNIEG